MSDFVIQKQSLLMKETDSDTYMLFSLIKQNNKIVLDMNNKDKTLIEKLKQLLLNKPDIMNIDYNNFDIEDINTDVELIDTFIKYMYDVDFTNALQEQIEECGSNVQLNTIFGVNNYIHYGLFSLNNILNYFRYWVYNLFVEEDKNEVLYPYGFMTIIKNFYENSQISMKNSIFDPWVPSDYFIIQNICESTKISERRSCFYMLNLLVNDIYYSEYPLFIELYKTHTGNESCYIDNKFQKVKDIVSNIEVENQQMVYHNKYPIQIIEKHTDRSDTRMYLAPSISYRFALISHGNLSIKVDELENKDQYKQYIYPFKNIQYYAQRNCEVLLGSNIDGMEQTTLSVCYDDIPSLPEEPIDNKLTTLPMGFYGPKEGDPESRANSFGLYDCQNKIKIKTNKEIFGENNNIERDFDYIFKVLFNYCLNNHIPLEDVELKIFACRTCCQPSNQQPMIMDGGENEETTEKVDSISSFESVNKQHFFRYLIKDATSCSIPQKRGGKKKQKATRQHKKKSYKNKTRKHKKYT